MNNNESFDVLVIGAGPAGSTAARVAAEAGARVLMVERKAKVGVPEQCGGYVSQAIHRHVELPADCIAQTVDCLRTHLPDGTVHSVEMPGYMLNRASLDRHLALEAIRAGTLLQAHTSAARLEDGRVILQGDGRESSVVARVIIGADGPRSIVTRWLGLESRPQAMAVQQEVALPRRLESADVYFRPAFHGGYAWLFPAGRIARLGVAFDSGSETAIAAFRALEAELRAEGVILESCLCHAAGPVPVGGPVPGRHGNILLVGDAAGHTHPITGAGVVNAIVAGEMAGRAAATAAKAGDLELLDEYEEDVQQVLAPALEKAWQKRSRLDDYWEASPQELSQAIRESWIAFDEYYGR